MARASRRPDTPGSKQLWPASVRLAPATGKRESELSDDHEAAPRKGRSPARRFLRNLGRWTSIGYFSAMKRRIWVLEQALDTLLASPSFVPGAETGFNGQAGRKHIFETLAQELGFEAIVETGTFVGNTAGWMHHVAHLPVVSSEINPRFHLLAKKRLEAFPAIRLELGNSLDFLARLAASPLKDRFVFFYLDAHWYKDLPLAEELAIIRQAWRRFVIMVDDFEAPGDPGYSFDDYGFGRALSVATFAPHFERLGLLAHYPALPGARETGARSGCVVLAAENSPEAAVLARLDCLRRA
jgi:hypothetical protein